MKMATHKNDYPQCTSQIVRRLFFDPKKFLTWTRRSGLTKIPPGVQGVRLAGWSLCGGGDEDDDDEDDDDDDINMIMTGGMMMIILR